MVEGAGAGWGDPAWPCRLALPLLRQGSVELSSSRQGWHFSGWQGRPGLLEGPSHCVLGLQAAGCGPPTPQHRQALPPEEVLVFTGNAGQGWEVGGGGLVSAKLLERHGVLVDTEARVVVTRGEGAWGGAQ